MSEIALPDPQTLAAGQVPALVERVVAYRAELRRDENVSGADDLRRRLIAYERYVVDKAARKRLEAESRRTEVLIGELLGSAVMGRPKVSAAETFRGLNDEQRGQFRELADYGALVESKLAEGLTARSKILDAIERKKLAANTPEGESVIRGGDFRAALDDLPDESVDMIFTDPPYAREHIGDYGDLAAFGARVLKPGASLLAYCGHYALPEILTSMSAHLRYWWLCACVHDGGNYKSLPGINCYVIWKPIVWFVKGTNGSSEFVNDAILRPAPAKTSHDWEQALDEPLHYIARLCPPDGLVVDPFAGGGTTLLAAKQLGRRFIGSEIDSVHAAVAEGRLAS